MISTDLRVASTSRYSGSSPCLGAGAMAEIPRSQFPGIPNFDRTATIPAAGLKRQCPCTCRNDCGHIARQRRSSFAESLTLLVGINGEHAEICSLATKLYVHAR